MDKNVNWSALKCASKSQIEGKKFYRKSKGEKKGLD